MTKVLKTLLVGVGGRGAWAVRLCRPENGFEVVGLCDPDASALTAAAASLNLPASAGYSDIDEAIARSGADCMIICAPTRYHVPFAVKGFDAGMAVLCEKGMAPDWESAQGVVAHAEEAGALFCVAQNYRYCAMEMTVGACLRGEVEGFETGPVFHLDLIQHRVRPYPRTLNYPFASVWDMSCHHFDNLLFWLGPAHAVTAQTYGAPWSPYQHPNNTTAHFEMASGARVHYFHGHDSGRNQKLLNFHGEKGALVVDDDTMTFNQRPTEQFGVREAVTVPPREGTSELGVLRDFYRYVIEGTEPGISGRRNLEVMAMCQMFVVSATEGRRVEREEITLPAQS